MKALRSIASLRLKSGSFVASASLCGVGIIGAVDYITGYHLSFSLFYLLPIAFVTWNGSLRLGIICALASAASWFLADITAREVDINLLITFWNTFIRLGIFLIVACALWNVKIARARQRHLTGFIVHDLRAPLANVMTSLYAIKEAYGEGLTQQQLKYLDMSLVSCNRMTNLINSILDLSALEDDKWKVHLADSDIRKTVDDAVSQVSAWAQRNKLTIHSNYETVSTVLHTDQLLLTRVLVNLLSNAIKASPPDSSITLTVEEHGQEMTFSVIDQGVGVPREKQASVFDAFVKYEYDNEVFKTGSGLGLTFCRTAVKELGGRIWIESGEGAGTKVTVALPLAEKS